MTSTRSSGLATGEFIVARALRLVPVVVVAAIVAGVLAFLLSSSRADRYESTTIVQLNTVDLNSLFLDRELPRLDTYALVASSAALIDTPRVRAAAAAELGQSPTPAELDGRIAVTPDPDSTLIRITVSGESPKDAAKAADAVREAFLRTRAADAARQLDVPIQQARSQIAQLKRSQDGAARAAALQTRLDQLEALRSISDAGIWNVQPADRPTSAVAPNPKRDAMLGAILGFILASVAVVAAAYLDPRVRLTDEFEAIWPLPVVAAVPPVPRVRDARVDDAFAVALSSLLLRERRDGARTIAVVSAVAGEGKTFAVAALARAAERAGLRVLVVDTDVRQPELARRFGIRERVPGLAELVQQTHATESVVLAPMDGATNEASANLKVLTGGSVNPAEFASVAGNARLRDALREAGRDFDLVLIDTAPAVAVADAALVAASADDVLVVARLDGVNKRDYATLRTRCEPIAGNVVGTLLIGAARPGVFSYPD